MGLSSTYPIMFDDTQILSPSEWNETSNVVETVNVTEAGTDNVEVTRYDKLTISAKFKVAEATNVGEWAKVFKEFSKKPSFTLKRYDILEQGYEQRTVRMRDFTAELMAKSDLLPSINGIWNISFMLIEF